MLKVGKYRRIRRNGSPGAGGQPLTAAITLGGNIAGLNYWDTEPLLVNALLQGYPGWVATDGVTDLVPDANGWPQADFRARPHWIKPNTSILTMQGSFTGACSSITFPQNDGNRYSLSAGPTWDSNTNTTTFTVSVAIGGSSGTNYNLQFNGTRRTGGPGSGGAPGVTNLLLAHPGYTIADINNKVWTDAAITYFSQFSILRTMDAQGFNNASDQAAQTWANARRRATHHNVVTWEDLIDLANKTNRPLHVQIPQGYSLTDVDALADFIESNLSPTLWLKIGSSNEDWNSQFAQMHYLVRLTGAEVKGFIGGEGTRNFTVSRSGSTCTFTSLGDDHLWTDQQTVYFTNLDGGNPSPVVTVTGAKTATFTYVGTNQQGALTIDTSRWVIGDLTTSLRYGSTIAADGMTNIYYLKMRYQIRRLKDISDHIRARPTIGDAKMGTRWRVTWEDQGIVDPDDVFHAQFDARQYLATKWTARLPKEYIWGYDSAPYFFAGVYNPATFQYDPPQNDASATLDQVVNGLVANAGLAKTAYYFEGHVAAALLFGWVPGWYEGGPDAKMVFNWTPAAGTIRCQAQFDSRLQAPVETMLADWFKAGGSYASWYTIGFLQATDTSADAVWGVTDDIANLNSPKLAAFAHLKANPPTLTRNVGPGTFDARTWPTDKYTSTTYPDLSGSRGVVRGLVFVPSDGVYTLRIKYTCNQASRACNIRVNDGANVAGGPFNFTNQGTGVAHATLRASGPATLADIAITLRGGPAGNVISILRTGNQNNDVEFFSVQII